MAYTIPTTFACNSSTNGTSRYVRSTNPQVVILRPVNQQHQEQDLYYVQPKERINTQPTTEMAYIPQTHAITHTQSTSGRIYNTDTQHHYNILNENPTNVNNGGFPNGRIVGLIVVGNIQGVFGITLGIIGILNTFVVAILSGWFIISGFASWFLVCFLKGKYGKMYALITGIGGFLVCIVLILTVILWLERTYIGLLLIIPITIMELILACVIFSICICLCCQRPESDHQQNQGQTVVLFSTLGSEQQHQQTRSVPLDQSIRIAPACIPKDQSIGISSGYVAHPAYDNETIVKCPMKQTVVRLQSHHLRSVNNFNR